MARRLALPRLAAAHAASAAGDTLVAIGLADTLFFSISADAARGRVGLYLLLTMTPFSILSPLIGPAMDRARGGRRLAVAVSAGGRALLCLAMAAGTDSLWLYPAAFAVLVLSRAHGIARAALVPAVLAGGRLVAANARLAKLSVVAGVVAGAPGVVLSRTAGKDAPLIAAAVLFAIGVVAALALPKPARAPAVAEPEPEIMPERVRRASTVTAAVRGLGGFLLFLIAFELRGPPHDAGGAGFGFVLGAAGAGAFAAATLVPRLRRASNEEWVLVVALIGGGGAALMASRAFGLDLAAVLAAAGGAVSSACRLAFDAIVQRDAPEAARARAFARYETTFQICWVAGAAIPVALPLPVGPALIATSVGFFGAALWFMLSMGASGRRSLSQDPVREAGPE